MRFFVLIFFTFCLCLFDLQAQSAHVLSDKQKYDQLNLNIKLLQTEIDSVNSQLTILKDSVSLDPNYRTILLKPIMAYESALFDLESRMGALKAQGASYEHKLLLEQSESLENGVKNNVASKYLLDVEFVKENISDEDRDILMSEIGLDLAYDETMTKMRTLYSKIKTIDKKLRSEGIQTAAADSIKIVAESHEAEAEELENAFLKKWNNIYETKIYVYSRLMQQLNISGDVISELSSSGRDKRANLLERNSGVFGERLYSYNDEKRDTNKYEKAVAVKINAAPVVDSLTGVIYKPRTDFKSNQIIQLPDYVYPTYEKMRLYKTIRYSDDGAHLPLLTVPTVGSIYSIRLITFSKPLASSSNVRKLEPLYRFVNVMNHTEYYTGVYGDAKSAEADIKRVTPFGFKANVVRFKDGGKVMPDGSIYPVDAYENIYYLEFDYMDDTLEAELMQYAPTKQINLIDNDKYSLGVFESYNELLALQKQLKVVGNVVKVKK